MISIMIVIMMGNSHHDGNATNEYGGWRPTLNVWVGGRNPRSNPFSSPLIQLFEMLTSGSTYLVRASDVAHLVSYLGQEV